MAAFLLLHNPKCSKSRDALEILKDKKVDLEVREYLKNPLSLPELYKVIELLGGDYQSIVRTKEESYKADPFSLEDKELIATRLSFEPRLMERPLIIKNNQKALVARPTEKLQELL